jgi:nucleotide-binding universal stress UspA family protein
MASGKRKWFDRILCPVDFSVDSDEGLRYAVALARAYRAKLYAVHCMPSPDFADPDKRRKALASLEDSVRRHILPPDSTGFDWVTIVLGGDSSIEIPRECAERLIDLLVIRSRRRTLAGVLGSTAEGLCRSSPCPVLVTGPNEREWAGMTTNEIDLHEILVAYDFSGQADEALSLGLSLAQECQAELLVMYVLPSGTLATSAAETDAADGDLQRVSERLSSAIPPGVNHWCKVTQVLAEGHACTEIIDYARSHPVDLICIGSKADNLLMTKMILGSTADRVVRGAPCPVLVARPSYAVPIANRASARAKET